MTKNEAELTPAIEVQTPQPTSCDCCSVFKKYCLGFTCAILSSTLLVASNLLIKITTILNGFEQCLIRYLLQLVVLLVIALYNKMSLLGTQEQRKYLILRGIFGAFTLGSLYVSLTLVKPSDTTSLFGCNVIFIAIVSRIYLKEKFTIVHVLALILIVFGVTFISQPSFLFNREDSFNSTASIVKNSTSYFMSILESNKKVLGLGLALWAGCCFGLSSIFIKKLAKMKCHYSVVNLYASYFGIPWSIMMVAIAYYQDQSATILHLKDTSTIIVQMVYTIISALAGNWQMNKFS